MKTTLFIATLLLSTPAHACSSVTACEFELQDIRSEIRTERMIRDLWQPQQRTLDRYYDRIYRPTPRYYTPSFY